MEEAGQKGGMRGREAKWLTSEELKERRGKEFVRVYGNDSVRVYTGQVTRSCAVGINVGTRACTRLKETFQ